MSDTGVTVILPPDASPELIARVREAFPGALPELAAAPAVPEGASPAVAIEEALTDAAQAAPEAMGRLADWWTSLGGGIWPLIAMAIVVAAGLAARYGVLKLLREPERNRAPEPLFAVRAPRAFWRFLRHVAAIFALQVVASAATAALSGGNPALADALRLVTAAVAFAAVQYALIETLAAPGAPGRRLMGFTEPEAHRVIAVARLLVIAGGALLATRALVHAGTGGGESGELLRLGLLAAGSLVTATFFVRIAEPLAALAMRASGEAPSAWVGFVARRIGYFYVPIVVVDFLVKGAGILGLLGPDAADASGPAVILLVLTPLAVAGLRVWAAEKREAATPGSRSGLREGLFAAAEGAVTLIGAVLLLRAWGIDPFAQEGATGLARIIPGLVQAAASAVVGLALWRAISAVLATEKRKEGEIVDEEKAGGRTRMDTILPILRAFLLTVVAVMTVMTMLSSLGVNIAPLLAGAGVLGLAIGFGAQRLVADVISGLFYLYEDAFRIGEYIEARSGKGIVEKIGLRSVVLRHHRGPLFTIPFSDMGTIQNHSRDWVKVKFSFDVPEDTDLEMVRKLIKKVGQDLEQDSEIQGRFLEPLKSQGAVAIKGRSFTIGCKFTTRPGEQFLVRRKIYAALQKALHEKGVHLFAPSLMVRTEDPTQPFAPAEPAAAS